MSNHHFHRRAAAAGTEAGAYLRRFRQHAGLSQLDLSLITGISQRHLSCIETGRANASPSTLHAVLSALDVPLEQSNDVFLAAGYAHRYTASPLNAPEMEMVYAAVNHILQANNPAPAIVIASNWDITAANVSTGLLFDMVGLAQGHRSGLNLLTTLLCPGGLGDYLINAEEIRAIAWQRATREAASNADLSHLLSSIPAPASLPADAALSPVVLTRVHSKQGELAFLSTFTTFGMPLDITVASLRIEHLIPADTQTWKTMTAAYEQWLAVQA
ncbi:helix-turn-helix domain-containing protein [Pseudomonas donghuensis]|uniref:helix-turn-helix domain-containing protein n=1 Tax=Pseudomonas donghuensis TaxID=1163398 RepID=UPI000C2AD878|nr:helix-turn-helix domain-containing protein [Pseudomonas donghuensis]PJY94075.1 transcriptional regulator [Pseudomonas donghuensis]WKY26391.1 helix-turn-helix domain-containing protein [Pseudomonas donghuensis]